MVIERVAVTALHPPEAAMVYVTVYVPTVLVEGVIAPVLAFSVNPAGELLKVPPCVPVIVQLTGVVIRLHKSVDAPYDILALGAAFIITEVVAVMAPHELVAATVYVTVYVPAVLLDGVIAPVEVFSVNPAGLAEKLPPVAPVMVGVEAVVCVLQ